jgi:DNA polymerase-3 subunit alpha
MSGSFVHLHSHSCFSLLDGLGRIDDLLECAAQNGMPALALTDHGTMFGAIEFYSRAKAAGVKPIVGCEVYVSDRPLTERPQPGSQNYHLVLLAENEDGYRNLLELTTRAHLDGFYRKPRIDHALIEKHAEGLICLSGCASSELATMILKGDLGAAEERADWYRQIFPERYYLELQFHNLDMQTTINQGILHVSQKLGLPLVATNDVHYVRETNARAHEILLCIQTQTTLADPKRMRFETNEFYLKSSQQMQDLFGHIPGAISNTLAIAERCDLDLAFGRTLVPHFATADGRTAEEQLHALCEDGLRERYPSVPDEARAQLTYELSVITETGFTDYILLVHDVIHFARSRGIAVGPGRGSAAGSVVAYTLKITNVDPLANGLSFERFLNPERVSMPDMDLDFADDRRDEVIRYVTEKYGRDRVAQIITFGTIGPRAGVRDVGRVLGMSYADVDRVAKLIPFTCSKTARAKEEVPELQQLYESDPAMQRLLDTVEDLEGVARHASTHAAGVVIARDSLIDHVPLYKVPKSELVTTQYAMDSIEKIGLLKMDFLGLRTLTILQRAKVFISQSRGVDIDVEHLPLEDPSIYELMSSGETFGLFQIDGVGMRKLIKQLKPTEFKHVVALLALYRPGPIDYIPEFAARKNGERQVTFDHPALAEVLEETFGIVVFQEQVMKLAVLVAGYSMAEGDLLRRAMGKKKPEELARHRQQFIERAAERGTERSVAEHLFDVIEPFAGYAFNKAHSAAYAVITCQTAYLKANYPREFMAGLLSAEKDNADRVSDALTECRRLGIAILPPDINRSGVDFTLEADGIRFGLSAIKHVGTGAIESILSARADGEPFNSLVDFCERVDWTVVNKRLVETFARSGAMDYLDIERARLIKNLDRICSFGTTVQRQRAAGQVSLFGDSEVAASTLTLELETPATLDQKIEWEQELLGTAVSRHPVADAAASFRAVNALPLEDLSPEHHGGPVRVGGLIRGSRSLSTRDGRPMARFQLTDLRTALESIAFSRSYERIQSKLVDGAIVIVDGRLDGSDGQLRLIADAVYSLEEAAERPRRPAIGKKNGNGGTRNGNGNGSSPHSGQVSPASDGAAADAPVRRVSIEIRRGADRDADMTRVVEVYSALQRFAGSDEVEILVRHGARLASIPLPNRTVGFCEALERQLRDLIGDGIRVASLNPR